MTDRQNFINRYISVVIPNYNGAATIGKCLEAAFLSDYNNFEVIVVDDCSTDNSVEVIKKVPCRLIQLDKHSGASKARNTGAQNSIGEILFFIDADCVLQKDTLTAVNKAYSEHRDAIIGGTYTKIPYDNNFFGTFQSIFINYSETKNKEPDYIATHAMVINKALFLKSGGFPENFLPILEDVEFSHRLKREGCKLIMNSGILVRHIFNFTLVKSLKNAFKKSKYWTMYSMANKDLLADSGTASIELKTNVVSFFLALILLFLFFLTWNLFPIILGVILQVINIRIINRKLLKEFLDTKGLLFAFISVLYYTMIYPLAVGIGVAIGVISHFRKVRYNRTGVF